MSSFVSTVFIQLALQHSSFMLASIAFIDSAFSLRFVLGNCYKGNDNHSSKNNVDNDNANGNDNNDVI